MIALVLAASLASSDAPSSARYYVEALRATRNAPQPGSGRYHEHVAVTGMQIAMHGVRDRAEFALGYGSGMQRELDANASFDARRSGVEIDLEGAPRHMRAPMFNPTWSGIEDWLKYGFYGPPEAAAAASAIATPAALATSEPRTIATVSAVDPGAYHIDDAGAAACATGSPGHRLTLRALRDLDTHPLTSVVIDTRSMRFCTMDFRVGSRGAFSFTGQIELHLDALGPYWMVKDGTADFHIRALGISAKHAHLAFAYDAFRVPND